MARVPILHVSELSAGSVACVEGTVRAAAPLLVSPLGSRDCVYWDVRSGLDGTPERREARDFFVEDDTGRVLVVAAGLEVEARAERQSEIVQVAETELAAVEERLRELKEALRITHGPDARPLAAEKRRLAKVATLLCAVRAHARMRVHSGKTLEGQARFIAQNAALAEAGPGARAIERMIERWEVVLAPGQRVVVGGLCRSVPTPAGGEGGYRDRAMTLALVGEDGERLFAEGVGAAAPRRISEIPRAPVMEVRPPMTTDRLVPIATGVVVTVALVLTWLLTR
jgi:hypothetical protein